MSEKYKWMTEQEFMEEVGDLDKLLHDFCESSDLYPYESVKININTLRDIIVRVHKRKYYFKIFHNEMITSDLSFGI